MTTSPSPEPQRDREGERQTAQLSSGRRVLLVDDERIMLTIGGYMLESLGFEVDTAIDGDGALKWLDTRRYDLVLTDLVMEGIDGAELARRVRHLSAQTKIIVMTGTDPNQVREKMAMLRVDSWLFKPFGISELRETLGRIFPDAFGSH